MVYPVLEVNEEILEQAGVTVREEWTLAEFEDACEQIKSYTGVYPFGIRDSRVCWFMRNALLQIWEDGEEMKRFQSGEISFLDPRVTEAFDRVMGLFRREDVYKRQEKYLGKEKITFEDVNEEDQVGIVRGLAWTSVGGDTLQIEVNVMPGKGTMQMTGQMGDVMKESAQTALSLSLIHI